MTLPLFHLLLQLTVATAPLMAQSPKLDLKEEEAEIRALIAKGQPARTSDAIFWSGAYKRPSIGTKPAEAFAPDEKRTNQKSTQKVERVEVAASGDMAWDFSYGKLEYDLAENPAHHVSFETSSLRVWKKIDGQWKVAAIFVRPLDRPFQR
jgi:hypothetical protein